MDAAYIAAGGMLAVQVLGVAVWAGRTSATIGHLRAEVQSLRERLDLFLSRVGFGDDDSGPDTVAIVTRRRRPRARIRTEKAA